jgi:hypothetical protein
MADPELVESNPVKLESRFDAELVCTTSFVTDAQVVARFNHLTNDSASEVHIRPRFPLPADHQ